MKRRSSALLAVWLASGLALCASFGSWARAAQDEAHACCRLPGPSDGSQPVPDTGGDCCLRAPLPSLPRVDVPAAAALDVPEMPVRLLAVRLADTSPSRPKVSAAESPHESRGPPSV